MPEARRSRSAPITGSSALAKRIATVYTDGRDLEPGRRRRRPGRPVRIDDWNAPHLAKHQPYTQEDVYDAFFDSPIFVDAPHEPALWLMIAEVPGDIVIIPLMEATRSDQLRPIGIYSASYTHREVYRDAWK